MPDVSSLSEAKRALLEKYLDGDIQQAPTQPIKVEAADERASIAAIQTGGSKRPFFFLHGDWRNSSYWCFPLAQALGSDQPFYALDVYCFDGLQFPPTFETMAAAYIKSLRSVQPEGPYLLGGFCNGGLLAYEMARQLHADGQKIDLLVLMDSVGPIYPAAIRRRYNLFNRIGDLLGLSEDKKLNTYILRQHLYFYLRFSEYRNSTDADHLGNPEATEVRQKPLLPSIAEIFPRVEVLRQDFPSIYDWVAMQYAPTTVYPGKLTFFWDSVELVRREGWPNMSETNEVEVHILPGEHMACRTEFLPVLAEHLRLCLEKVQTGV